MDVEMHTVQVFLSAYNGASHLKQQIESILNQDDVLVELVVRDDGSSDNTADVLSEYDHDSRVNCIYEQNVGVKSSFLKLLTLASPDKDYYAFADQDDIWLPDKLITAIRVLEQESSELPLVYGSSVYIYRDGQILGKDFLVGELGFGNFLVKNYFPGCTMVFNYSLVSLINKVDFNSLSSYPLHDHWINLVCTACGGKVITCQEPKILYRQHGENVVGQRKFLQKVRDNGLFGKREQVRYKVCKELDRFYGTEVSDEARATLDLILRYDSSLSGRVALVLSRTVKPCSLLERIALDLIVLTGRF